MIHKYYPQGDKQVHLRFYLGLEKDSKKPNFMCQYINQHIKNTKASKRYAHMYMSFNLKRPSTTLTKTEGMYFSFYKESPDEKIFMGRRLLVREIAELQSFDQDFDFSDTTISDNIKKGLLGNSVTVDVCRYIFEKIISACKQNLNPHYGLSISNQNFFMAQPSNKKKRRFLDEPLKEKRNHNRNDTNYPARKKRKLNLNQYGKLFSPNSNSNNKKCIPCNQKVKDCGYVKNDRHMI